MSHQIPSRLLGTSRYSTDEVERNFLLYKIRKAHKEFLRGKRRIEEFKSKHVCELSPYIVHNYQLYKPHPGCAKHVCKFCLQENPDKIFQPSVYSFKGRTFEFKPEYKFQPPRRYEA